MRCPKCQYENRDEAKFCSKCRTVLVRICPLCQHINGPDDLYCEECSTPLVIAIPTSLKNNIARPQDTQDDIERRLITALFVDIYRSKAITANKSPEIGFRIITQRMRQLTNIAERYEGYIAEPQGDGTLALFGYPIVHENDAERAILAALDMIDVMQSLQTKVRIGIETAIIPGSLIKTQSSSIYTVFADEVTLAKRLEEIAEPMQILVGTGTHSHTKGEFDFSELLPRALESFPDPVPMYAVLHIKSHPEKSRGIEGLQSPMVGRDHEYSQLKEASEQWLQGQGRIVSIIGEAGIGKTRLVKELRKDIPEVLCLEGRCISIGRSVGYKPFLDILRSYFKFRENDDSIIRANTVKEEISDLFVDRADDILPFIGDILSIRFGSDLDDKLKSMKPDQIGHLTKNCLVDFFITLSKRQPVLLILEDLHWADELSLDLVSLLMNNLGTVPLMLICIYRFDKDHRIAQLSNLAWRKCPDNYTEINLTPLSAKKSRQLIDELLVKNNLSENVINIILKKTRGNPFSIEGMIGCLKSKESIYYDGEYWNLKQELSEIDIPSTNKAVILAEVDSFNPEIKKVLECASVIGDTFKYHLLEYLTQYKHDLKTYLTQLEKNGIIGIEYEDPELEYAFNNPLTRQITYERISDARQKQYHHDIAVGIESLYQDHLEEYYDDLAIHYSKTDKTDKAIEYLFKAGDREKRRYANNSAINYFEEALQLIQRLQENEERALLQTKVHEALGDVLFTIGANSKAEIQFSEALKLASKQGDTVSLAAIVYKLADAVQWQTRYDQAIEIARHGLAELRNQVSSPEVVNLLEMIARCCWAKTDWGSAHHYSSQIAQIIHQIPYYDSIYNVYYALFWVDLHLGLFDSAFKWLEEMQDICSKNNNQLGLGRYYHGLGDYYGVKNELTKAKQCYEESLEYCERIGETHVCMESHLELATILNRLDADTHQIEYHIQRGEEIANQMASPSGVSSVQLSYMWLLQTYSVKGNIEQSRSCFQRVIEFGLPDSSLLSSCLNWLEYAYVFNNQHEAFFDFCQQMQQKEIFQQSPLCYWHLQPSSPSENYSKCILEESFDNSTLQKEWRWIDLKGGSSYSFSHDGIIELRVPAGHAVSDLTAPRILRVSSGDFAVETVLLDAPEEKYQNGGLFLQISDEVFICFGKASNNEIRLDTYQQGRNEVIGRGWLSGTELFLRLEHHNNLISALCSNDGKNWYKCGETLFPEENPVWIGLFAACPVRFGSLNSVVWFQGFKLFQRGDLIK